MKKDDLPDFETLAEVARFQNASPALASCMEEMDKYEGDRNAQIKVALASVAVLFSGAVNTAADAAKLLGIAELLAGMAPNTPEAFGAASDIFARPYLNRAKRVAIKIGVSGIADPDTKAN